MSYHTLSMGNTGRYILHKYRYYFFFIFYTSSVGKTIYLLYIYIIYIVYAFHTAMRRDKPGGGSCGGGVNATTCHTHLQTPFSARSTVYIYIYLYVCVRRELIELNLTLLEAITNTESIFYPSSSCSGMWIARDGIILVCEVGWHIVWFIHVYHI